MKLSHIQEAKYHQEQSVFLVVMRDYDGRVVGTTGPFPSKQTAQDFIDNFTSQLIKIYKRKGLEYGKEANFVLKTEPLSTPQVFADNMERELEDWL